MRYFSLFSGIGGFEKGIMQAYENYIGELLQKETNEAIPYYSPLLEKRKNGITCVGYSEIDPFAIKIYQQHFKHKNYGDITKIRPDELPEFDFLCGGFPCQSFPIAGKRKGFDDTRGTLFFDIARILKAKQPRRFLLENVKGLLSHDNGQTFRTIIATLDELGYDLQWQVLNSKDFGVPQNRERVYIVGHLRGTSRPEVFPIGFGSGKNSGKGQPVFATIRATYPGNWNGDYIDTNPIDRQEKEIVYDGSHFRQEVKLRESVGFSPTLNTAGGGGHLPLKKVGNKIRKLTPLECERLQGFPDNWTQVGREYPENEYYKDEHKILETFGIKISDSQRYKTLGNAVTVNVVDTIISKLLKSE